MEPDDPKVVSESEGILEAIALETLHGEYQWSQILKRDEVQTGKRVLLAYGMQFMNQMGGINLVVVSFFPLSIGALANRGIQYYVTSGEHDYINPRQD